MEETKKHHHESAPDVLEAIQRIVHYLWHDELKDYRSRNGSKANHIFRDLVLVNRWLSDPIREPNYFGDCPRCKLGGNDGYLNLGRSNWFHCHLHRLRWCIGDLVTTWRQETEEDWRLNWDLIGDYKVIRIQRISAV